MPSKDVQFSGSLSIDQVVRVAPRCDIGFYGEDGVTKLYFPIDATDNAGPGAGTSTVLISAVASTKFAILGMYFVAGSVSTATWVKAQFFSAGTPTNHTGQFVWNVPAGASNVDPTPHPFVPLQGPMFVTNTNENFSINVVSSTAGQAVRVAGYGVYIQVPA